MSVFRITVIGSGMAFQGLMTLWVAGLPLTLTAAWVAGDSRYCKGLKLDYS